MARSSARTSTPFPDGDVVPGVGAEVGVDLGQGKVMPAAAGDGRQVTRRRREEGKRQSLAVANTELAAGGMGLDGLFAGDDPLIIGKRRRQPDVGVRRGQDRPVPGRRVDSLGLVIARQPVIRARSTGLTWSAASAAGGSACSIVQSLPIRGRISANRLRSASVGSQVGPGAGRISPTS